MGWARVLAILLVVGSIVWLSGHSPGQVQTPFWQENRGATAAPELARLNELLAELADKLKPALVQVRVLREEPPKAEGEEPPRPRPDEGRRTSGSGFIIRPDGLIVTNAHVVADAKRIQIRLSDGRRFEGRLVGKDNRVDLAVLQIDGVQDLPVLSLGDSEIDEVPEEDSAKLGLRSARGVLVRQVMAGEPAEQGGLQARDVILSVDGEPVQGPRDLQRVIAASPPGRIVRLGVMREGKETELSVTVGLYKEPSERQRSER